MKKILAGFMAFVIMLTSPAYASLGYADGEIGKSETLAMLDGEEMTVKGTDSFGTMLADSLSAKIDEQDSNEGYNVFSIEVKGREASVSFEALYDAALVVGIYDEDGIAMLGSGKTEVSAGDTEAVVSIEIDSMPQYFYLRGFLVDENTLRPLCTVYESPNYTKEMQEFFAKTTDDFDADRVLNLDNDKTNNFAVYSDKVTVVSGSGITVESIDEGNNTYVFKNADSIAAMQQGDTFSYECADGNVLIVKVDNIRADDDTITVTGIDTSMEDVFEYVKIDTESDMSDITVDDSSCGEGVIYNGIVDDPLEEAHFNALEGSEKLSKSLSYTFLEDKTKGISGDVNLKAEGSIKVYISWSYQYIELKLDYSAKINVKISVTDERKMPIGFIGINPLPGVFIEFSPSIITKVSASMQLDGKLFGTLGLRAERGKGIQNISTAPDLDVKLKGEFSAFVGLSMEPKIKIVSDNLANASLNMTAGAEAKGVLEHEFTADAKTSNSKIHDCKACIDGEILAKADFKFKTELLKSKKFTFELPVSFTLKICDWYFSIDYADFGFSTCPHYLYKTTITVQGMKNSPVMNAEVKVPFIIFEKDENGNENKTKIESIKTDNDGKVEGYLASGKYDVSVMALNYNKAIQKVTIEDNAKSTRILMMARTNEGTGGNGEESGDIGENPKPPIENPGDNENITPKNSLQTFSLVGRQGGTVTVDGSLYMWGQNWQGSLGDGTASDSYTPKKILDNVVSVSLTGSTNGAITADGSLYMWGDNRHGQLGDGTIKDSHTPKKILDNVVSVSIGSDHSGAVTVDGSLYMWGTNDYGQLGDGTREDSYTPKKILDNVVSVSLRGGYAGSYSGAITADGSLYMWGRNYFGSLGNGTREDSYTPRKILDNVVSVSLREYRGGAITAEGNLYMWGRSERGENGGVSQYTYTPGKVLDNVASVSLGDLYSGAITMDGSLYMWGANGGSLGDGTTQDSSRPKKILDNVVSVSLGDRHSGAVTDDGSLYMWGYNSDGQLGDGTNESSLTPKKILDNVILVSLGSDYVGNCSGAVTVDGSLYMWGCNYFGTLGDGTTQDSYRPKKILENVKINNKLAVAKQTRSISSASPSFLSVKETGKAYISVAADGSNYQTVSFMNLIPNAVYNFYAVRSRSAEDMLHTSNLLHVSQVEAGADGFVHVSYKSKENDAGEQTFVVGTEQYDIASAVVNVADLECTQRQQYIQPVVTYQGKTLIEWEDYELLGDYSATDVGDYIVTIHGIGEYKGSVDVSYKITESKSRKIERIALSAADASLNTGNTLQLIAEVFPENAENKTLQWSSSDEKVAIVDANGRVTAIGVGQATITVKSQDGSDVSASCVITVTKLADNLPGGGSTGDSSGGATGGNSSGGSSGGNSSGSSSGGTTGSNPSGGSTGNNSGSNPSENDPDKGNNGELQVKLLYYIIDFNANGGSSLSRKTMTLLMDDTLGILPKIQRKQYDFKGWYTQKSGGEKVTQATVLNVSTTLYAQWAKTAKSAKPEKLSLKAKKGRQMKVGYKKVSGASGYQIAYSTSKKFASSATKKVTTSSTSKVLKNLKKGKTYYVRVRAYKTDSAGNKVFGKYSEKKSITIKS